METSDDECFESADEGVSSSDYEEETEQPSNFVAQKLNQKIVEPEICKLKAHDLKNVEEGAKKEEANKVENVDQKDKSRSNESSTLKLDTEKCDSKNILETSSQNVNEQKAENYIEEPSQMFIVENDNKKNQSTPATIKTVKEHITVSENKEDTITNPKSDSVTEPIQPEDNLWDDDELDWGSEAVKEESQKTEEHSPMSKNEDSGWDDFDAEWESENQLSSEPTSRPKTEYIATKSNTSSQSERKSDTNISSGKENLWEDDEDWEPLEKPEDKPKQTEEQSGWSGWGSWGVSSLLNTATQGVSTLTSHVSQGLTTVLESGIGIPDPEEMARIHSSQDKNESKEQVTEDRNQCSDDSPGFHLDQLVSGMSQLTKFVETTGTKVITGGLDTLEAIGKKTVEVLQEGDPGLKKKRALLKLDSGKPNLSQILREAKEKSEQENQALQEKYNEEVKRTKNYEALFDDHQGLVHLEALEMLSRLCSIKLSNLNNSLSGDTLKEMQETLEQVKELCELPDDEEEEKISSEEARETIINAVKEINIPVSYNKLFATCEEADTWLDNINLNFIDDVELHQQAIETLAQLTAFAVEQFHKTGELLMVKEHRSTADEADSLVQITTTLKSLILCQAGKFTDKLSSIEKANKDDISEHITNIFYEAANSGRYIQDAFQLLIPVMQVGAV